MNNGHDTKGPPLVCCFSRPDVTSVCYPNNLDTLMPKTHWNIEQAKLLEESIDEWRGKSRRDKVEILQRIWDELGTAQGRALSEGQKKVRFCGLVNFS